MDQIAADEAVSKQIVYKQFTDKEQFFRDIAASPTWPSPSPTSGRAPFQAEQRPSCRLAFLCVYAAMTRECRVVTAFRAEVIAPCCQASM